MLRAILGCALGLLICGGLAADDKGEKIDAKKLVGKWSLKEKNGPTVTIEFTKDGKVHMSAAANGKELKADGTYKVNGNKVVTTINYGGKDATETHTVTKLTDTELVTKDEKGTQETLTRVKGK